MFTLSGNYNIPAPRPKVEGRKKGKSALRCLVILSLAFCEAEVQASEPTTAVLAACEEHERLDESGECVGRGRNVSEPLAWFGIIVYPLACFLGVALGYAELIEPETEDELCDNGEKQ